VSASLSCPPETPSFANWEFGKRSPALALSRKPARVFFLAAGPDEKKVRFSTGLIPGLDQAYQVDRARFDALLLDHARELGADIRLLTTVCAIEPVTDGLTVTLAPASALPSPSLKSQFTSRYVIDAGGRDNFFPAALKTDLDPARLPTKRIAIYNHFRGVSREAGPEGGDTVIVRLPEGWFWIIPIDAERTSVGLVTTQAAFKTAGLSPAEHFARVVASAPRLRKMLFGSSPVMEFHVTADYSYYRRRLASDRLILAVMPKGSGRCLLVVWITIWVMM